MNKKWNIGTKKGYLKIHVAVDDIERVRKYYLCRKVTDEHVHDGEVLPTLVDDLVKSNEWKKLDKLLAMVHMTVIILSGVYQRMVLHHVSESERMQG